MNEEVIVKIDEAFKKDGTKIQVHMISMQDA